MIIFMIFDIEAVYVSVCVFTYCLCGAVLLLDCLLHLERMKKGRKSLGALAAVLHVKR